MWLASINIQWGNPAGWHEPYAWSRHLEWPRQRHLVSSVAGYIEPVKLNYYGV